MLSVVRNSGDWYTCLAIRRRSTRGGWISFKPPSSGVCPNRHPVYAPAVNGVADYGGLAEAEKLGLKSHGHPCMAVLSIV